MFEALTVVLLVLGVVNDDTQIPDPPSFKQEWRDYEPERSHWDALADCESGDWDRHGTPIEGTARWDYGLEFSHGDIFEGGLNFHPVTWDSFKPEGYPAHAGMATREQQILVGRRVQEVQGWGAWPVCSRKVGLR